MKKVQLLSTIGVLLMVVGFALMAQSTALAQDAPAEPVAPPFLAAFYEAWQGSGHADSEAEAFHYWDNEAEPGVPTSCAKCHSTPGYLDFLGEDGSEFGTVDAVAPLGTTVNCDACHNATAASLTTVTFPSGLEISTEDNAARCMVCHQGRASGASIDAKLTELNLTDLDAVSADLGFINIHYYAAAATLYGSEAAGGYQYPDKVYQMQNVHVPDYDTCTSCHNPHTLEINIADCAGCHDDVENVDDLRDIRMNGSRVDFDGDEDNGEGIYYEIETLQEMTLQAIQVYAREVAGTPIAYSESAYPYWFIDTNDNGEVDEDEAVNPNKYVSFTPHLLQAAYNYQVTMKDPGGYAHNAVYLIQLLFDSIETLNAQVSEPVDLSFATRHESGHFDVTAFAFRDWDADGEVPARCTKCHTAEGLPFFLENGVTIAGEPSNSLACSTCHDSLSEFTLHSVAEVTFPSGAVLSFGEEEPANLCLNCHQGRESTVSVNRAISASGVGDDEVSADIAFRNVHYFAAGATLFGTEAKGAYEYEGREYNGRNLHDGEDMTTCDSCHREHELTVRIGECEDCHEDVEEPEDVRMIRVTEDVELIDYDGDGSAEEPIADEIDALEADLLVKIQAYSVETIGTAIAYNPNAYPYWFIDTNGNGTADEDEVNGDNRYASWTPTLLRAAYNYQYIQKDPGVFVHNPDYALQVLFDSLEAIGGAEAVASYNRPPVVPPAES